MSYLLFGPRQLAFELPVLIPESLVLTAQRCKALSKLLGDLGRVVIGMLSHGAVNQRPEVMRQCTAECGRADA